MSKTRFIMPIETSKRLPFKLCKNCKHFKDNTCQKYVQVDLISGSTYYPQCNIIRYDSSYCGVGGKDYEPIEEKKK
jgi:hypothetical protein